MDDATHGSDAPTVLSGSSDASPVAPDAPTMISGPGPHASSAEAPTILGGASEARMILSGATVGAPADPGTARGPQPVPGESFGPYIIERALGSGGMGDVYLAEHVAHGRRIALKVLGRRLAGAEDRARFLREGELAASIAHPNTVYVYGSEEIAGSPVIAMELLSGGTLKDIVHARGPLPTREAVDLILQVTAGLEAAQASGILHRDVKPANCFVDRDGSVKVGDFGLSIATSGGGSAATGMFQGTPQFAPPEQIRGEALDVRADIYAVGATLFFLLTGRPPFDDPDLTTLITRVQKEAVRSPREMRAGVPQALAEIVSRCLSKAREDRPATYAELAERLRPFSSAAAAPASIVRRTVAGLIDAAAVVAVSAPFTAPLLLHRATIDSRWWTSIQLLAPLLYYGVLEGMWGAGLGKVICGITVAREDGRPAGVWRALGRAAIFDIPSMVGVIPAAVLGTQRFTELTLLEPGVVSALSLGTHAIVLLLFVTARKANGFAAVHELATGTRVVRRVRVAPPAPIESAIVAGKVADRHARRYGPFEVLSTVGPTSDGTLLAALDRRLSRQVWIHVLTPGVPAIAPHLRDLGRPGRLRWLGGARTEDAAWDAYESLDGAPLLTIDAPQPWAVVKRWVLDLAAELDAGLADESIDALAVDRVWITRAGRAKLLDIPAPGAVTIASAPSTAVMPGGRPTLASAQRWLADVAGRGLSGGASASAVAPAVLPLSARTVLDHLRAGAFTTSGSMVGAIAALLPQADVVAPWRRAWSVALCGLTPVVLMLFGLFGAFALRSAPTDVFGLEMCLNRVNTLAQSDRPGDAHERAALETYIAWRYGPTISTEITWSMVVNTRRMITLRPLAMRIVNEHRVVTPAQLADARTTLADFLPGEEKARADADRRAEIGIAVLPSYLFVAGFAVAAFCGVGLAAALGDGLLLRLFGVAVVTKAGERASRLRGMLRAVAAWLPALGFAAAMNWSHVTFTGGWYHVRYLSLLVVGVACLCVFIAGAVVAALRPTAGIQDRIAGTRLVPR